MRFKNIYKQIALSLAFLVLNKTSTSQVTTYTNSNVCVGCKYFVCGDTMKNTKEYELNLSTQLYTINTEEINLVDSLIKRAVKDHNSNLSWIRFNGDTMTNDSLILSSQPVFILRPFLTIQNQKLTLIKYMCRVSNDEIYLPNFCDWQRFGGGTCYFSLWVNLTERNFFRLIVNSHI